MINLAAKRCSYAQCRSNSKRTVLTGGLYDGPIVPSVVELLISETVRYLKLQRIAEDRTKETGLGSYFWQIRTYSGCSMIA